MTFFIIFVAKQIMFHDWKFPCSQFLKLALTKRKRSWFCHATSHIRLGLMYQTLKTIEMEKCRTIDWTKKTPLFFHLNYYRFNILWWLSYKWLEILATIVMYLLQYSINIIKDFDAQYEADKRNRLSILYWLEYVFGRHLT